MNRGRVALRPARQRRARLRQSRQRKARQGIPERSRGRLGGHFKVGRHTARRGKAQQEEARRDLIRRHAIRPGVAGNGVTGQDKTRSLLMEQLELPWTDEACPRCGKARVCGVDLRGLRFAYCPNLGCIGKLETGWCESPKGSAKGADR